METKIFAFAGKGGVGKTSFSAAFVRILSQRFPHKKILAVDADPAVGLSTALQIQPTLTLDDIRLQIYPKGYHIRISPSASKEQVRVAKTAVCSDFPLSFMNVGCSLISAFKENEDVEAVRTVFITKKDFDYRRLSALAQKVKKITDAVHSTLQLSQPDCASCKLKPVCDEVEGLRKLH